MAVKIAHASIDERGRIAGGAAGDQAGKEVCTRLWYNKNWDYVIRFKDVQKREKAAAFMEKLAANNNVGYDQYNRNTLITQLEKVGWDPTKITTKCECDCSSAITAAAIAAGVAKDMVFSNNACTTMTLRHQLVKTGLVEIFSNISHTRSDKYALRGDIYLKEGSHVIMVIENNPNSQEQKIVNNIKNNNNKIVNNNNEIIKNIQSWLNKNYKTNLIIDGQYGSKTKIALIKGVQTEIDAVADGKFGPKSKAAIKTIKNGSRGDLVTLWQSFLVLEGYNPNGIDGIFGKGCETATKNFQKNNGLTADGQAGPNTWYKALN